MMVVGLGGGGVEIHLGPIPYSDTLGEVSLRVTKAGTQSIGAKVVGRVVGWNTLSWFLVGHQCTGQKTL